jgi:spore_ybaN_pdaB: polysaccharide deacetylase family sporulation protein PdaB
MHREGHLIGNHTYNHVRLDRASDAAAREEILKTNNRIYEVTGSYPVYMRPPYGAWKKETEFWVEMIPVFWTIDTLDWKTQNTENVIQTVRKNIKDGSIILMHDEYASTVEAALDLVDEFTEQGWEFVTVDRLILP